MITNSKIITKTVLRQAPKYGEFGCKNQLLEAWVLPNPDSDIYYRRWIEIISITKPKS